MRQQQVLLGEVRILREHIEVSVPFKSLVTFENETSIHCPLPNVATLMKKYLLLCVSLSHPSHREKTSGCAITNLICLHQSKKELNSQLSHGLQMTAL
jgi:hypothetical protein